MTPVVSIIMGSTSDLPVMEKAAKFLDEMEIPFEMHALSAHRTPAEVEAFAKGAKGRGIKVIIAAAGMAAHFCQTGCRERNRSHYRRSRYGCPSAGRDCRIDPAAGHRCTHQIVS